MNLRVLACCALASLAAPASAHALLDHAKPGAGAVLHAPPASVTLLFSDDLDPESTVAVVDGSGHSVAAGRVTVAGNCIMAPLRPLRPGKYRVVWHAVSMDDHRTQGAYEFAVKP